MTLTTPELISLIGLITTAFGVIGTMLWNIVKRIDRVRDSLNEHKLYAASNFVSMEAMRLMARDIKIDLGEVRDSVHRDIGGMNDRIDSLLAALMRKE
jgi:hypothetical protein